MKPRICTSQNVTQNIPNNYEMYIHYFSFHNRAIVAYWLRMDDEKIKESWWKYGSGYHIGDALRFDHNNLKGDTIYRNDKPIAIITYCGKGMFRNSAILEVESIATGESGTYHDKGPQ